MKVDVRTIRSHFDLEISGTESWLKDIYHYFSAPAGKTAPLVHGHIAIQHQPEVDGYSLKGKVSFEPFVDCSRCGVKIQWPINESFDLFFVRKSGDVPDDADLNPTDLDEYALVDNIIDIESILNEQIQLAIPTKTVKARAGTEECLSCGQDLSSLQVFGENPEEDPANPFAVLKTFKAPN